MASDLPDMGFPNGYAMARSLVTYIECPRRVQRAVKSEFSNPPALRTIMKLSADYLTSQEPEPFEPCRIEDTYYPGEAAKDAENTNREFLWRLDQERLASQRRKERGA